MEMQGCRMEDAADDIPTHMLDKESWRSAALTAAAAAATQTQIFLPLDDFTLTYLQFNKTDITTILL